MAPARTRDVGAMKDLARRIVSVDDFDPHLKALIYGRNGVGKTPLIATAPKVLIVDIAESGTRSTVGSGARKIEIDRWEDVGHVYWLLQSGKLPFQSVGIDTITGLHRLAMDFVIDDADRRNPARPGKQPDKRDYGRAGELTAGMLFAFRNLPMNVIFAAHERVITDDDGMEIETTVNLPAGVRAVAMDIVGIMGYMPPPKKVRKGGEVTLVDRLIVGPSEKYRTKDKSKNLPATIVNPTVPKLLAAWNTITEEN